MQIAQLPDPAGSRVGHELAKSPTQEMLLTGPTQAEPSQESPVEHVQSSPHHELLAKPLELEEPMQPEHVTFVASLALAMAKAMVTMAKANALRKDIDLFCWGVKENCRLLGG